MQQNAATAFIKFKKMFWRLKKSWQPLYVQWTIRQNDRIHETKQEKPFVYKWLLVLLLFLVQTE